MLDVAPFSELGLRFDIMSTTYDSDSEELPVKPHGTMLKRRNAKGRIVVYVIGHRGTPVYVPENTIESFKKAIGLGVDFVECDVHLSRDEEIVVIHDDKLDRTTSGRGRVKDFTLEELKKLTISSRFRIPTIEEVLGLDFPVLIELKSFHSGGSKRIYPNLAGKLLHALHRAKSGGNVILMSFDRAYIEQLRGSGFKRMLLFSEFPDLDALKALNLFGVGVEYHALNAREVNEAHNRLLSVMAWTADQKEDIEKVIGLGVDFVVSNDPELAIETTRQFGRTDKSHL